MRNVLQLHRHVSTGLIFAAFAALLLVACSKKEPEVSSASTAESKSADAATASEQNPCSLLEARDVEAALGGPLAGPPYRYSKKGTEGPDADGDACRYETAGFHAMDVEVEWTGGAQTMKMYGTVQNMVDQKMKGVLKLANGSELTGEWDEARVVNCCIFVAMRGDQLVSVDIAGTTATLEQAGQIADAALRRIEKPLTVDSAKGVAEAIARDATRPKTQDPCSLVSRAEAAIALESPLEKDPLAEGSKCTYTYSGSLPGYKGRPIPRTITLDINWRYGYANYRQHSAIVASVGKMFAIDDKAGVKQFGKPGALTEVDAKATAGNVSKPAAPDPLLIGPWEAANMSMLEFSAVKKDVRIMADARGAYKQEHARNLVAAAMSKL
jgi:hypothetical protein